MAFATLVVGVLVLLTIVTMYGAFHVVEVGDRLHQWIWVARLFDPHKNLRASFHVGPFVSGYSPGRGTFAESYWAFRWPPAVAIPLRRDTIN